MLRKNRLRWFALACFSLLACCRGEAEERNQKADVSPKEFRAFLAAGTAITITSVLLDHKIRDGNYADRNSANSRDLRYFGDAMAVAGPLIGVGFLIDGMGNHRSKSVETARLSFESFGAAVVGTGILKYSVGRDRPSHTENPFHFRAGRGNASFPSGHTAVAFAAATTVSEQYPQWQVVVPSFVAASAVGYSRMAANKHWLSDVLGGAVLGSGLSHLLRRSSRQKKNWKLGLGERSLQVSREF